MSELENTAQGTSQNEKISKISDGSILNSVMCNWDKRLLLKRQQKDTKWNTKSDEWIRQKVENKWNKRKTHWKMVVW